MTPPTLSILVVDDDDAVIKLVALVLRRAGYTIVLASDGKQALELYDPQTIGLVLTDLVMPDMKGIELIAALRHRNPSIKIIAMSGDVKSMDACLPSTRVFGADFVLEKPFAKEELFEAIRNVVCSGERWAGELYM
jgi:CheY-like chemotaxis protein